MLKALVFVAANAILLGTPAIAQKALPPSGRPEILKRVVACRSIADLAERAHCYDREVAVLDEAERKRDIMVVDRQGLHAARRSLFGLRLPGFRLFGDDDERDEPAFTEIETKLSSASRSGTGWLFVLEDGARWVQTEPMDYSREPRTGNRIRIRRASLGSYLANIDGQRAVRVKRIN